MPTITPATQTALAAAQANLTAALVTFATSTLPPLAAALGPPADAIDLAWPRATALGAPEAAFFNAAVRYVNGLIAAGRYSGPPFPWP